MSVVLGRSVLSFSIHNAQSMTTVRAISGLRTALLQRRSRLSTTPSSNIQLKQQPRCRCYSTSSTSVGSSAKENSNDTTEYGVGMDQEAMMESDLLIAVDENDVLIPDASLSKRQGHSFTKETPRAVLHRAFSFFLFNSRNEMLLTQRANSKITFPGVWTNTCCSHPLYDMTPNEVDVVPDAYPEFPGIKHAALRKVKHELGIDTNKYVAHDDIHFITRFHYWAADTLSNHDDPTPWGEHEVDYILFFQTMNDDIPVNPNPDEVAEYKFVSIEELKSMMEEPGLLWSPWFRGIMDRGGWDWWADLPGSLQGKYTNPNVCFFDPPSEHVASYNLPAHDRKTGVLLTPSTSAST